MPLIGVYDLCTFVSSLLLFRVYMFASCVRLLLVYQCLAHASFLCSCLDHVYYGFAYNTVLCCTVSFRVYFCFAHAFVLCILLLRADLRTLLTFILSKLLNCV